MQSSSLNSNRGILRRFDQITKSLDAPSSPQSVVDGDAVLRRQPVDDEVARTVVCGCFQFWDFFGGNDNDDSFTSILLKDIKPVREEDLTDQQQIRNTPRSRSNVQNENINEPGINQIVDFLDDSFNEENHCVEDEKDNMDSHVVTIQTEIETFQNFNEEKEDDQIKISFSLTTFSEGEASRSHGDNEEHYDDEQKILEEDNSSGSSSLSFDPTEFEEQDFEADYGLPEINRNFNIEPQQDYLPTIQENVENSFSCEVGQNLSHIFICHR